MRILVTGKPRHFEKDSHTAIAFYRFVYPLKEMMREDPYLTIIESTSGTMPDLAGVDAVMLHTPTSEEAIRTIAGAMTLGKTIWLDFDDLVWDDEIPLSNLAWTFFNAKNNQEAIQIAITAANVISVSTVELKRKIIDSFQVDESKIWVIPNALPDELWARRNKYVPVIRGHRRILWRGSVTHEGDLLLYQNAFKPIKNSHYCFMGAFPWMLTTKYRGHLTFNKDIRQFSFDGWQKQGIAAYFEKIKAIDPHYVVVPLESCDFNRAKSNIAWLEGTYAGAACIANDDMPEFASVPCTRFDTVKSLNRIFEQIGKGEDLRTENYMKSRAVIEEKYLLSITNKMRFELLNSL